MNVGAVRSSTKTVDPRKSELPTEVVRDREACDLESGSGLLNRVRRCEGESSTAFRREAGGASRYTVPARLPTVYRGGGDSREKPPHNHLPTTPAVATTETRGAPSSLSAQFERLKRGDPPNRSAKLPSGNRRTTFQLLRSSPRGRTRHPGPPFSKDQSPRTDPTADPATVRSGSYRPAALLSASDIRWE